MPKKTTITKACPKCDVSIPVASKTCRCGYSFNKPKPTSKSNRSSKSASSKPTFEKPPETRENVRRRTSRTRREKPNYYDSLEFDKQKKKSKPNARVHVSDDEYDIISSKPTSKSKKRKTKKEEDEEAEANVGNFGNDKQMLCSIILSEINRKITSVAWRPS